MAQGLPRDAADQINAASHVNTTGPQAAVWQHIHSGHVTLTLADPHADERRSHFNAQQRLREAQLAYTALRQSAGGTNEQKTAVLQSLQPLLAASGAQAAAAAAKQQGQPVDYDWYLTYLRDQWLPHLTAKERQAANEELAAVYGTAKDPHQDPLLGQLTNTTLAEWRLEAERAHRLGLPEEEYRARMAEAKWHNDRADRLRQMRSRENGPARRNQLDSLVSEADAARECARGDARAVFARPSAQSSPTKPKTTDDAFQAGLHYGSELRGIIADMVRDALRMVLY